MPAYFLSESDVTILKEIVKDYQRKQTYRRADQRDNSDLLFPPETYIAKTPGTGINALKLGSGIGTGSESADSPGSAECDIYRLLDGQNVSSTGTGCGEGAGGDKDIIGTGGLKKIVYNLSTESIPGASWVLVHRDKFGSWIVGSGSGGGAPPSRCEIVQEFVRIDCVSVGTGGDFTVKIVTRPVTICAAGLTIDRGTEVDDSIISVDNVPVTVLADVDVVAECVGSQIETTVDTTPVTIIIPAITCGGSSSPSLDFSDTANSMYLPAIL